MDHLGAMRAFVSVAKLGSFAEAARRLQLSPSVVTRSVAQLEDQLGLTLLLRTTRSLRLTERGELYLESCEQILQDVDSAERQVRGEDAEPRGTLKVAAPIVFGRLHVLPIVNRVLRDYRDVAVELTLSDRNAHLVEEGVDVAVRIGELADSSLIAVKDKYKPSQLRPSFVLLEKDSFSSHIVDIYPGYDWIHPGVRGRYNFSSHLLSFAPYW